MTFIFKDFGNYGRQGNMMFQCSSLIGAARHHNDNWRVPYVSGFQKLNIPNWSNGCPEYNHFLTYNEPHFHYSPIPKLGPTTNIKGYFQSEKYFEHCKEEVRQILMPKDKFDHSGMTAIHVRRTDYLDPRHKDCYHILTRGNYYDHAMQIVPGPYLVFSDDLEWCKSQFIGDEFSFSEEKDPITDLAHMIGCSNFIIANSSFSWWGAWLSQSSDKVVVAPRKWFGPKLAPTHDTKDLIPPEWIQI